MYKILLLSAFVCTLFSACCTKKKCVNAFEEGTLNLKGFTDNEIDSIYFVAYSDKEMTVVVDTAFATDIKYLNPIYWYVDINPDYSYQIHFKAIDKLYEITDIKTGLVKCNSCFLTNDMYEDLISYKVNGVEIEKNRFELTK